MVSYFTPVKDILAISVHADIKVNLHSDLGFCSFSLWKELPNIVKRIFLMRKLTHLPYQSDTAGFLHSVMTYGLRFAAAAGICVILSACQPSALTNRPEYVDFSHPETAVEITRREHSRLIAIMGGYYTDPQLNDYVQRVTNVLSRGASDGEDVKTIILNSPLINAFALPANRIYLTRGLIAHANSEAELAAFIAHEMAQIKLGNVLHVFRMMRQHSPQAQLPRVLAHYGNLAQMAGFGIANFFTPYTPEQVYEADQLGIELMAAAGYDPIGMVDVMPALENSRRLENEVAIEKGNISRFHYLNTHPRNAGTVLNALTEVSEIPPTATAIARGVFLDRITGMQMREDARLGVITGSRFTNIDRGYAFNTFGDFEIFASTNHVTGINPSGASFVVNEDLSGSIPRFMDVYIRDLWARQTDLRELRTTVLNVGQRQLQAATARVRVSVPAGEIDLLLAAIQLEPERVLRFLFATPPELTTQLSFDLQRTLRSFRLVPSRRIPAPLKLDVIEVQQGDTQASIANRMRYPDRLLKRLRALNGLVAESQLQPGRKLKIVTQ